MLLNKDEPECLGFPDQLRRAGFIVGGIPTSGCSTITVDHFAFHGRKAIEQVVESLLAEAEKEGK